MSRSYKESRRVETKVKAPEHKNAQQESEGKGVPVLVYYKGKHRPINDGAGLCSPGRWRPSQRKRLRGKRDDLGGKVWFAFPGVRGTFWKLASGKVSGSPFGDFAKRAREEVDVCLVALGEALFRRRKDRETEINMRRLEAVASCLEDEDFGYLEEMASAGVCIGVDVELPRRWSLRRPRGKMWSRTTILLPRRTRRRSGGKSWKK